MKLATFILSIYLLLLSLVPCADRQDCNEQASAKKEHPQSGQHKDHDNEICTPFCVCACCHTIIAIPSMPIVQSTPVVIEYQKLLFVFIPQALQDIAYPVWQPPQLV